MMNIMIYFKQLMRYHVYHYIDVNKKFMVYFTTYLTSNTMDLIFINQIHTVLTFQFGQGVNHGYLAECIG